MRPWLVGLPHADDREAPVALRPAPRPQGHFNPLRAVRHLDGRWWWPVRPPEGNDATTPPAALSVAVARAAEGGLNWSDWPFEVRSDHMGRSDTEVIRDADLRVVAWETDYDRATRDVADRLARDHAVIDGALHVAVGRPEVVVAVDVPDPMRRTPGTGFGRASVSMDQVRDGARHHGGPLWQRKLSVQRFSPTNPDAVAAYVSRIAAITGQVPSATPGWDVVPGPAAACLARDDHADFLEDLCARVHDQHCATVGHLPTSAVRTWLDLRDAGRAGDPAAVKQGMLDLYRALSGLRDGHAVRMRKGLLFDLVRIGVEDPHLGLRFHHAGEDTEVEGPDPGLLAVTF